MHAAEASIREDRSANGAPERHAWPEAARRNATRPAGTVLYNPGGFVLSNIQKTVPKNLEFFHLGGPSCITHALHACRPRLRIALQEEKQRDTFVHIEPPTQQSVTYIGRPVSATTATAAYWIHAQEQAAIIEEALAPGAPRQL